MELIYLVIDIRSVNLLCYYRYSRGKTIDKNNCQKKPIDPHFKITTIFHIFCIKKNNVILLFTQLSIKNSLIKTNKSHIHFWNLHLD